MNKKKLSWIFLISLVLSFLCLDAAVAYCGENLWKIPYNDFEATRAAHPEEVWDKVFFGNSTVIAAYQEDQSQSGYINLGMDYAVVTDLWDLLRQEQIQVGSELVIGLNLFALYDDFDTNPSYIWHRQPLEPYTYFHRDKLMKIVRDAGKLRRGEKVSGWTKILYPGSMDAQQLQEKMDVYNERYFCLPQEDFEENIQALDHIADWCGSRGVRLRIVWMPYNPSVEQPELMLSLMETVNQWCTGRGIEALDLTNELDASCFHDVGHLNMEHGAAVFMEEVEPWLAS